MATLRFVAYIRVSRVRGREGDSFQSPRHQRDMTGHAIGLIDGAEIVSEFIDLDESGGTMDRPELDKALREIDDGRADGIVVAKLDRFARTLDGLAVIERLERNGKVFVSAAERFDTSTPMGRFALGMMVLIARLERDRHIETWDSSNSDAIARGVHTRTPYGYRRREEDSRLEPLEPHATIVRRIFAERARGMSWSMIARGLNDDGIGPPSASAGDRERDRERAEKRGAAVAWTRQAVRAIIATKAHRGVAHWGDYALDGAHEALVSEELWQAVQPGSVQRLPRGDGQLLAGILRCAACGYTMGGGTNAHGGRRYRCLRDHGGGTCPAPTTVKAEAIEEFVTAAFLRRYGDVQVAGAVRDTAVSAAAVALEKAAHEFEVWRDDTEMREILGHDSYRAGLLARSNAVTAARDAHDVAVRGSSAAALSVSEDVWADLGVGERRELLKAGIDHVELSRASSTRAPVAARTVIRWAGEGDDSLPRKGVFGVVRRLDGRP